MRIKANFFEFSALLMLLLLLSGCAASQPAAEVVPATTEPTTEPTVTPTPEPTSTPLPTYDLRLQVTIPGEAEDEILPLGSTDVKVNDELMQTDDNGMLTFEALTEDTLELTIWTQGFMTASSTISMQPGANENSLTLEADPFAMQIEAPEGYEIVYIEDFQDEIEDFVESKGNFGVFEDETNPGNTLLEVDLRNLEDGFFGTFGEKGINDFIVQARFRYPEISYTDFATDEYYNWQGYGFNLRGDYKVEGYPLQVPWGPTFQFVDASKDNWEFPITVAQYIKQNEWYTLKVVADGPVVEGYINGVRRFRYLQAPEPDHTDNIAVIAFVKAWIQYDDIVLMLPTE